MTSARVNSRVAPMSSGITHAGCPGTSTANKRLHVAQSTAEAARIRVRRYRLSDWRAENRDQDGVPGQYRSREPAGRVQATQYESRQREWQHHARHRED